MNIECYHIKNKDQHVKGFLDYGTCSDIENTVRYNVYTVLEDNGIDDYDINYMYIYAHGSRVFGNPRKDSDIDFVLFYKGLIDENSLFNIFANESIYIEHIKCDFNPISIDDYSDMEFYIQKHDIEYNNNLNEEFDFNLALDDDYDELQSQITLQKDVIRNNNSTKELLRLNNIVVDLGLPSGTLWSKYNLGVDPNKLEVPEDWYGDFYAWGETEPKDEYSVKNYKWFKKGKRNSLSKYNTRKKDGDDDGQIRLLPEDDAAYVNAPKINGYTAHIPDFRDLDELRKNTSHLSVRDYKGILGLHGEVITSKINGNTIFLPYSGMTYSGGTFEGNTFSGCSDHHGYSNNYWLLCNSEDKKAHYFGFDRLNTSDTYNIYGYGNDMILFVVQMPSNHRFKGLSIRPIYKKDGNA